MNQHAKPKDLLLFQVQTLPIHGIPLEREYTMNDTEEELERVFEKGVELFHRYKDFISTVDYFLAHPDEPSGAVEKIVDILQNEDIYKKLLQNEIDLKKVATVKAMVGKHIHALQQAQGLPLSDLSSEPPSTDTA